MKVIGFQVQDAHPNNRASFLRMCKANGATYTECDTLEEIGPDTDLVWSNSVAIPPQCIPERTQLLLGPGCFVLPSPDHPLFVWDYRGRGFYTCLSPWIKTLYEEFIQGPRIDFVPCPFPVDTTTFSPDPEVQKSIDCLVYFKYRNPLLKDFVLQICSFLNLTVQVFEYGSYKAEEYLTALRASKFAIWIGCHESQGFALQECLATNVPMLVLDVVSLYEEYCTKSNCFKYQEYLGTKQLKATSVPYWDARCGQRITSPEQFPDSLVYMYKTWQSYRPREFILETLSDQVCWYRILANLPRRMDHTPNEEELGAVSVCKSDHQACSSSSQHQDGE